MNAHPKISVIMPSLNQGEYLGSAIDSVLSQGSDVELIVIDGGSIDRSPEIIRKYSDRLAYWVSEADKGQSHAINKGIRKAKGEVITWLNSDDLYEPGALKAVWGIFAANPDLDLLHGRASLFGRTKTKVIGPTGSLQKWEYLPYMRFPQPSSFFRRRLFERISPLDEKLNFAMDHELVTKAVLLGSNFKGVADVFSKYRLHTQSKSMSEEKFMDEWSAVFNDALSSLPAGKEFASRMTALGLAGPGAENKYTVRIELTPADVRRAWLEHLHLRLHGFYRQMERGRMKEVLDEIKRTDPVFAKKNRYDSYMLKLTIIPRFIYRLYRRSRP